MPHSAHEVEVDLLRAFGQQLSSDAVTIGEEMAEFLAAEIPAIGADEDPTAQDELRASCCSNMVTLHSMLAVGIAPEHFEPPVEALEWSRTLVRRGVELPPLLRAYRLGHQFLLRAWCRAARESVAADQLPGLLEQLAEFSFTYVDVVCARLEDEYRAERDRWLRSSAARRGAVVQRLLDGEDLDTDATSLALGYELRGTHLALVLAGPATGEAQPLRDQLTEIATRAAALLGCGAPLLVPVGHATLWAWYAVGAAEQDPRAVLAPLNEELATSDVRVAAGRPQAGTSGFAMSHREADRALRVALRAGHRSAGLVHYDDVAISALLGHDATESADFVADRLGPLAEDSPAMATLRETLLHVLESGSYKRAAAELGVHVNTVTYRVRRAEELAGRTLDHQRLELQLALRIAEDLGAAVLRSAG